MKGFTIIAGPCSIDKKNADEAVAIGNIPEVDGVRCVGLKSVTSPRPFMGIDADWFFNESTEKQPSLEIAKRIVVETGKFVAMELMDMRQLHHFMDSHLFIGKMFLWNPAIMQLGWPIHNMAKVAKEHGWRIGLKNPKWSSDPELELLPGVILDNGEKTWWGNAHFSQNAGVKPIMIQRGIEGKGKKPFRNLPNHAASTKMRKLGLEVYFDPSHSFGKELRDRIVDWTLEALEMRLDDGRYLYTGLLIEVGTSQTDTDQHISIDELKRLIEGIKKQREL